MKNSTHSAVNATADALAQSSRAAASLRQWNATTMNHRLQIIGKMRAAIATDALHIARQLTDALPQRENAAQTLAAEILPLLDSWHFLEKNAKRILAQKNVGSRQRPLWLWGAKSTIYRDPKGVVLIISPFNYPLLLAGVTMAQALVSGNTVLLKPARHGKYAADLLVKIAHEAGVPHDVLQVMDPAIQAGLDAIDSGHVNHVVMTGSTAAGQSILSHCSTHLVSCTLELSGNDAVFVLPDADLDHLTKAITFGLSLNSGATCIAPRRMYAHASLYDQVCSRLQIACSAISPVNAHAAGANRLLELARNAIDNGAKLLAGDLSHTPHMQPILLCDVKPDDPILRNDIFAPVLSIIRVKSMDEAVSLNDACPYALGASVFGPPKLAAQLAGRINAGSVTTNDLIVPTADPRLPFGGKKASGYGVTRGEQGLLELTSIRCVTTKPARFQMHLRPKQPNEENQLASIIGLLHASNWTARFKAIASLLKPDTNTRQNRHKTAVAISTTSDERELEREHAKI